MTLSVLVTNQPPDIDDDVAQPLRELFQAYTRARDGQAYSFFRHQAEVFRLVEQDWEVFLVAGTAAGKTLAIALPLFHKLKTGRIRKALFMYPTIALMDDQRQVMETLARITGLEIGQLQGGMSRIELMAALNKAVILATPDEVYWFFHKNVKYSSLLIYGLCQVDEFVLDEAHLFNGLALRNLSHLKRRLQLLGERLGKWSRWHVLTATPTSKLHNLTDGAEVLGRSKCGDVAVTFLEPTRGYDERLSKLLGAVESALAEGARKVLLVFNSADLAHRVFETVKGKARPELPADLKWRFGRIPWGKFKTWLEQEGVKAEAVEEIERWLKQEGPFYLKDLTDGAQTTIPIEVLASRVARLLEGQIWALKRLVYMVASEEDRDLVEAVESKLGSRGRLLKLLWSAVRPQLENVDDVESVVKILDDWVSGIQATLERIGTEDSLTVTAPAFAEIVGFLQEAGIGSEVARGLTDYLKYAVELPEEKAASLRMSPKELAERRVAFSWLEWLIKDQVWREAVVTRIQKGLEEGQLKVEVRHIAVWGETGVPVVIYTGKMSRAERKGLIEAFATLPRAVLISTPAVEVGVDFAADTLITEQCDGNGFLQRFGRVGRRPGIKGKVLVLLKDGETYVKLSRRYQPRMSREEFSALIADPANGIFPLQLYAEGSTFLDATHWLVNTQLGEIGQWLNQAMFGEGEITGLAQELRVAGLPFAYGLRGTLPEVSLQGGASSGEPFYILRKVPNERLLPSDSPFEMARADMAYVEFLWKPSVWRIVVDVETTLKSSQALFWWQDGRWHLRAGYGIAADYVKLFSNKPVSNNQPLKVFLKALEDQIKQDLEGFLSQLRPQATKPLPRLLLQIGKALPLFFTPYACFVLGQGDVHLLRLDQDGNAEAVEDRLGNPLVLPDQLWLLLYGYKREEAERLLKAASAMDLEEVIYEWYTLEVQGSHGIGPILLDRVAGACFAVYRRLVEHVGR